MTMTVEKQFLEYVFFAYSVVFLLLFVFVANVWRRSRRMEQQLAAMEGDREGE